MDAVRCAIEAQGALGEVNSALPETRHINFRIGVHVGDIMVRAGDVFGDGVNMPPIADRCEGWWALYLWRNL